MIKQVLANSSFRYKYEVLKYFGYVLPVSIICFFLILSGGSADAAISAVSLTAPAPTPMSNGRGYYLAGTAHTYVFTVTAVNPGASGTFDIAPNDYGSVAVRIPTGIGANYIEVRSEDGLPGTVTVRNQAAIIVGTGSLVWTGTTNSTFTFTVTFDWLSEVSTAISRNIVATVTDFAGNSRTNTVSHSYGICSGISVAGFAQTADASDGFISPRNNAFTVSGIIVYDIPGYALETTADKVDDSDITSPALVLQTSGFTASLPVGASNFSLAIGANALLPYAAGSYTWRITESGKTSVAGLVLRINTVHVTGISFTGGIGRGPDKAGVDNISRYYHKYGTSGTMITIFAETATDDGSGQAMHGDTVFTVQLTGAVTGTIPDTFTVTIPSGQLSATVVVPYNTTGLATFVGAAGADPVERWTYQVIGITSVSGYEINQASDGNGIPVTESIYWDNGDAPTAGVTYITATSVLPAATSVTIYWNQLSYAVPHEDFYEYKIHFRETSGPWRIWDGVNDVTLAWPPASLATNVTAGVKYTVIPNLKIFTTYEYYITAVDIFGNESNGGAVPGAVSQFKTLPYSIQVTLSDGITQYPDASFANLAPSVRPLRETNIKVNMRIVSATEYPETVRVWFALGDTSTSPDIVLMGPTNVINSGAFSTGQLVSSTASKTAPNEWTAYLSTQTDLITAGANIRFIVETVKDGVASFSDHIMDVVPNPNLSEWTFTIVSGTKLTPWPVRVLNNVITKKHPVAYPSYYLTDPANVTIEIFDIRGQQIVTLIDGAYRLGGQNIKENGWNGRNKAGRDCGPGLYYIHFKAKRASDGKVIIDEFKKIVIAR